MVRNYKPTGRPRGRPRKADAVAQPPEPVAIAQKSAQEPAVVPEVVSVAPQAVKAAEGALQAALDERGRVLESILSPVFNGDSSRTRIAVQVLTMLSDGVFWSGILSEVPVRYNQISAWCSKYPVFSQLRRLAEDEGRMARHRELEESAYKRASRGVERPVFQGGVCVGAVREYSDKLAALFLSAGDPRRYGAPGGGSAVNIQGQNVAVVVKWSIPD
jgi:hypothetical protein